MIDLIAFWYVIYVLNIYIPVWEQVVRYKDKPIPKKEKKGYTYYSGGSDRVMAFGMALYAAKEQERRRNPNRPDIYNERQLSNLYPDELDFIDRMNKELDRQEFIETLPEAEIISETTNTQKLIEYEKENNSPDNSRGNSSLYLSDSNKSTT